MSYSISERWTGEFWIDGKPIYSKIISGNATFGGNLIGNIGSDYDVVCGINGCYSARIGQDILVYSSFFNASTTWRCYIDINYEGNVYYYQGTGQQGQSEIDHTNVEILYTKTTDTAGTIPPFVTP